MTDVAKRILVDPGEPRRIRPARAVCRLTIAINGMDYQVNPNVAEGPAALKAYRLTKTDGTEYDLAEHISPPVEEARHYVTCDCPDFIFRRDGIDPEGCKHIKAMVAFGLLENKGVAR
jgi:hypothetical protein